MRLSLPKTRHMNIPGTRQVRHGKLTWIDVQNPTLSVLNDLKDRFGFHDLDIEDCISETQRSKIDEYDEYLFIILHIAFFDKKNQRVVNEEVDIFIKNDVLITIHAGVLKPLLEMFEEASDSERHKEHIMEHGSGYLLYEITDQLYSSGFPILDLIEKNLNSMERDVFSVNAEHDMVRDILSTKKNIISFRRIISPQRAVIVQLEHKNKKFMPESLDIYFDDVVDKIEKIWGSLENLRELVETLHETNETLISHTTNNVIKILTTFSVVMLPLTFLTGLYGMNVALPLAEHDKVFFMLTGLMFSVVLMMLAYFKFKKWI